MGETIMFHSKAAMFVAAFAVCARVASSRAAPPTTYTLPASLHWVAVTQRVGPQALSTR
jgi:hypothetical protein